MIKCPEIIGVALTDAAYDAIASTLLRRKMSDDRQYAPATLRNRDFILDVLFTNVRKPILLDASQSIWPIASADGIICINMVHISPWEATSD